ncbi:hypothetical protein Tco_0839938 [Tanacetum coccineum]|uniref:Uncharacterized protein n=1 Tax=Tanacetum coccineum TaxID=301880 RepID=A0ABQ5AWM3_9ASTR
MHSSSTREVAERLLALPNSTTINSLSYNSSPLPQIPSPPLLTITISPTLLKDLWITSCWIRQRVALPVHETEMPEICLPLRKRPRRTTPGPRCEVGESSAAGRRCLESWLCVLGIHAVDLCRSHLRDCIRPPRGVNQRVSEVVLLLLTKRMSLYSHLDEAREEARLSRAAWARSMDACDQVHSEGISLRTTVMAQQSEITELQAADRRRQAVITDLLKADYRRQRQLVETLKICGRGLMAQNIELQRQQGPAKDPAEPELPEEAKEDETKNYCPRNEIKKIEDVPLKETDKIERYVGGMPDPIYSSVVASKPKTMQEAIEMATELMDRRK